MIFYSFYRHNFYVYYRGLTRNHTDDIDKSSHVNPLNDIITTTIKEECCDHDLNLTILTIHDAPNPKLSLMMRIVAIESGFLLDALCHRVFNF